MALKKKKEAPAEESVAPKAKEVKKKASSTQPSTLAQRAAAEMAKNKKISFSTNVIFDPNEPIATASDWVRMPHPWNKLTGTIGVPMGHFTVIQGRPDSGKTTLGMHALVEAQQQGYNCVIIDTEHKFNWKRLAAMGADLTNILPIECETIEDGFEALEETIKTYAKLTPGVPTVFLWDSLGQTPTDEEMKGTSRSFTVASAAKVIKKNYRRLRSFIKRTNTAVIMINQIYSNVNALFGNSTKGYGGDGPYYAAVLVLEVQRIRNKEKQISGVRKVVGMVSGMKCTKNHLSDVQGAKVEVIIGPKGVEQDSIKDLDDSIESMAAGEDDDDIQPAAPSKRKGKAVVVDDDLDEEDDFSPRMRNGREASL